MSSRQWNPTQKPKLLTGTQMILKVHNSTVHGTHTVRWSMSARKVFVFLGAAGVGKGTFAEIISRRNGWAHISTG